MCAIYKPAEDTLFLASIIEGVKGCNALEICTGSGYIARILAKNFKSVVATDIDVRALLSAKDKRIDDNNNIHYICCDGADAIVNIRFDLIAINPPYLPSDGIKDVCVDGGKGGIEVAKRMLESAVRLLAYNGAIYMLLSSLSDYLGLISFGKILGLEATIIAKKRYFFEDLLIIRFMHVAQQHQDP